MPQSLSNLPVGAKIKFGKYSVNGETPQDIIWLLVDKNYESSVFDASSSNCEDYPSNAATLLTEKSIDIRCFDAAEPNSMMSTSVKTSGYNRYSVSNLHQWLNKDSAAGQWYEPLHGVDTSPTEERTQHGTPYAHRPGFLNAFLDAEKAEILDTKIRAYYAASVNGNTGNKSDLFTTKVFLPSERELNLKSHEGYSWAYFKTNSNLCSITEQAYSNTTATSKPSSATVHHKYWIRRMFAVTSPSYSAGNCTNTSGETSSAPCAYGDVGVRPAINVPLDLVMNDTTDSDGCYTVWRNESPSQPSYINVPSTLFGGRTNTISWAKAVDPDGDNITYVLECAYDGGDFSQIYSGNAISYTHNITFGKTSVQYRVKAIDSYQQESTYITSVSRTIINNHEPTISGADDNLGTKTDGFSVTYGVNDADADSVTVIEAIDGVQIRSYIATLGATNSCMVTEDTWLKLSNGSHIVTITAKDTYDTVVRTYTFVKNINSLSIQNTAPMGATSMPTRIALTVSRHVPAGAIFIVEVCNNGFDDSPTWEDATSAVESGLVHQFTNTTKTATQWGVKVRVTLERNGSQGACYISAIGGNFE